MCQLAINISDKLYMCRQPVGDKYFFLNIIQIHSICSYESSIETFINESMR